MIDVLNGPQFQAAMKKRAQALSNNIEAATKKTALGIKAAAMRNTPVKTGNLRKNWKQDKKGKWHYEVRNDVDYAPYVEFGTWKMAPRAMLGNAVLKWMPIHKAAIHHAIRKSVS